MGSFLSFHKRPGLEDRRADPQAINLESKEMWMIANTFIGPVGNREVRRYKRHSLPQFDSRINEKTKSRSLVIDTSVSPLLSSSFEGWLKIEYLLQKGSIMN